MSRDNAEIVLEQFTSSSERDAERAIAAWADDIELVNEIPGGIRTGRFAGKTAVLGWFTDWFASFEEDVRFQITAVEEVAPGKVLVTADHRARGRGSGIEVEMEVVWLFELNDGKIVRMTHYRAAADALEALPGSGDEA